MSNSLLRLRRLLIRAANAAVSQNCYLCGARAGSLPVCEACRADLPFHAAPACPVCALPTAGAEVCGSCLRRPPAFDSTRVAFDYAFPIDALVQALKYRHRFSLAPFLGSALCLPPGADLVVPMPLHRQRLAERGFNQAVEIARPLARAARVPLALAAVERVRPTQPQARLGREARERNLRGAFACRLDLDGAHVAVIDDVMTTGASLEALASCLKSRGAVRVDNCVVARTAMPP